MFIEEIYKVSETANDLEKNLLLKYEHLNGKVSYLSSTEKWTRRSNLKGTRFDGFAMTFEPYVIHSPYALEKDEINDADEFSGMFIQIMDVLGDRLNFTVTKTLPPQYDYNEVIRMVSLRRKDMALGIFSITHDRSFDVDFSLGIKEEKSGLFYPKKRK